MKKRIICALCCALMIAGLTGCGNENPVPSQQSQQSEKISSKIEEPTNQEEATTFNKEILEGSETEYVISKNTKVPTETSSEEEMKAFYEEVVTNMFNVKNYHVEQRIKIDVSTIFPDSSKETITTISDVSADYSLGKTDDEKKCATIHNKAKVTASNSRSATASHYESYLMRDPQDINSCYAFYEKESIGGSTLISNWEEKSESNKSSTYYHMFPEHLKAIKINKKESTPDIIVLEGTSKSEESTGIVRNKIKIDIVNRVILQSDMYIRVTTDMVDSDPKDTAIDTSYSYVQKYSKIGKNITVKIPDTVNASMKKGWSGNIYIN